MSTLILTASQAHRFWSAVQGCSPHVEGDVVEVASKSSGDLYLRLAAKMWREGVAAWPLAIDGKVEAVILAETQEDAGSAARIALGDLAEARPSLARRTLRSIEGGFEA